MIDEQVSDTDRVERVAQLLKNATPDAAAEITALAQTESKEVRQAARRALYLLGQKGISAASEPGASADPEQAHRQRHRQRLVLRLGSRRRHLKVARNDVHER